MWTRDAEAGALRFWKFADNGGHMTGTVTAEGDRFDGSFTGVDSNGAPIAGDVRLAFEGSGSLVVTTELQRGGEAWVLTTTYSREIVE